MSEQATKKSEKVAQLSESVIRELVANDFRVAMHGKLEPEKLEAAVAYLKMTTTAYPAHGSIASLVIYAKCQCVVEKGKTWDGNAWGTFTPGGGALFGNVYTDDLDKLYRETNSFQVNAALAYTSFIFYDAHTKPLGSFQSGSVSTVVGFGGGTGKWS